MMKTTEQKRAQAQRIVNLIDTWKTQARMTPAARLI